MKLIPIALSLIAIILAVIFVVKCKPIKKNDDLPNYNIKIILPLSDQISFDNKRFIQRFQEMWNEYIVCGEIDKDSGDTSGKIKYGIGDKNQENIIWITYSPYQIKPELTNLIVKSAEVGFTDNEKLGEKEISALQKNIAYLEINYMMGKSDAKGRTNFTAKTLITLSNILPVIGYIDASAQSYRPKLKLLEFENRSKLEFQDLFLLFVNVQVVSDTRTTEIHTHGMDQFWLPDIQMVFEDSSRLNYNFDVLRNCAVYLIDKGNILQVGHTAELAGDGVNYEIVKVKEDKDHPFGSYGVIGLRRQ